MGQLPLPCLCRERLADGSSRVIGHGGIWELSEEELADQIAASVVGSNGVSGIGGADGADRAADLSQCHTPRKAVRALSTQATDQTLSE